MVYQMVNKYKIAYYLSKKLNKPQYWPRNKTMSDKQFLK
jgi:hypothetical protein